MVKVDVGHHGERRGGTDLLEAIKGGGGGDRHADDLAPGVGEASYLLERRGGVVRLRRAHGLHGDGGAAADLDPNPRGPVG